MISVHFWRTFNLSCKTMMIFTLSFSGELAIVDSAYGQNPWMSSDKPLIEEGGQLSTRTNTWKDKALPAETGGFDESKYPPLDEDRTLGTGAYGEKPGNTASDLVPDYSSSAGQRRFDPQSLGEIPTYPDSNRGYPDGNYGNNLNPLMNNRNQSDFWPGNRGMNRLPYRGTTGSGFPFSPGSGGGFPFSGGNGSGFPFGGGNGWMPFSNSGYW